MSTSLFDAIRNADVSMVTSLVKENPSLAQEKDQRGSTALTASYLLWAYGYCKGYFAAASRYKHSRRLR